MTQKTIKALYKQPVNYKLTKDGYKTINTGARWYA